MKTSKLILIFIILLSIHSNAQPMRDGQKDQMKAIKVGFITNELALTTDEAAKFWPIYNQMEKERWDAQKLRRELEDKVREAEENLSDAEVTKLTRDFAGSMQKEGALATSYNEKFLKVLPPKKVLKLYKAENEFRMNMIRKYRDGDKNDKGPK